MGNGYPFFSESSIVAVVDDHEPICSAISSLLRANGFRVKGFLSAEAFLKSVHFDETVCLLLDIHMPEMNGFELQRYLVGKDKRIPIIFMTASGYPQDRMDAMRSGASGFLRKPFSEEALLGAIRTAVPHFYF